jgi:hypothetical protein
VLSALSYSVLNALSFGALSVLRALSFGAFSELGLGVLSALSFSEFNAPSFSALSSALFFGALNNGNLRQVRHSALYLSA